VDIAVVELDNQAIVGGMYEVVTFAADNTSSLAIPKEDTVTRHRNDEPARIHRAHREHSNST
jgi:hypothetical protein